MADITVNLEGYGQYTLTLNLHDPGKIEVWSGTFTDRLSEDEWTVFFEMDEDDYEVWDLIDVAIETYRDEYTPDENQD
jgi:hypothetical protein